MPNSQRYYIFLLLNLATQFFSVLFFFSHFFRRYLIKEKKKIKGQEEKQPSPLSAVSKVNSPTSCQSGPASPAADIVIDDDNDGDDNKSGDDSGGGDAMPVPQVMLGPDGSIVLNDARYVIGIIHVVYACLLRVTVLQNHNVYLHFGMYTRVQILSSSE